MKTYPVRYRENDPFTTVGHVTERDGNFFLTLMVNDVAGTTLTITGLEGLKGSVWIPVIRPVNTINPSADDSNDFSASASYSGIVNGKLTITAPTSTYETYDKSKHLLFLGIDVYITVE